MRIAEAESVEHWQRDHHVADFLRPKKQHFVHSVAIKRHRHPSPLSEEQMTEAKYHVLGPVFQRLKETHAATPLLMSN
jgi:hypothetical protein